MHVGRYRISTMHKQEFIEHLWGGLFIFLVLGACFVTFYLFSSPRFN